MTSSFDEIQALGEYDVIARIGRGGMAEVLAARLRTQPDRLVALKVIRPELGRQRDFVAMFLDEARIASRLSHPNIAAIYGLGHDAGRHYLAMELLRGRTLLELWSAANARGQRVPFAIAAWIGARVAEALHHAHELSDEAGSPALVVHRDVTPSNIFVCASGEPKVIDFGLAKARDRIGATAVGVVKGKLSYLSPEQVAGKPVDRRSDIFSLGVTLWEITVDRRLFREDDDVATARRVLAAEVPDPVTLVPEYPPALASVVHRALARDPMDRFANAAELAHALDAFVAGAGGCSAAAVAALFADLFPPESAPAWERLTFAHEGDGGAPADSSSVLRVWDDDSQKMTWMAATAETLARQPSPWSTQPAEPQARASRAQEIDAALVARIATLTSDPSAVARAHLERALVDELLGDGANAAAHAESARAAMDTPVARGALRRLLHARGAERALAEHQAAALEATVGDAARGDRWAERARLLRAAGEPSDAVQAAYERALECVPLHAAALKGLEVELRGARGEGAGARLAGHLATMADAYAEDPELAARLHVERADLLAASDGAAEREALRRAIALAPGTRAVRAACVAHASKNKEWAWLAELLGVEAASETDAARAAALELDAACVERLALGRDDRAVALLERAAARAPTAPRVDARVAGELVLLHERAPGAGTDEGMKRRLAARRRRLGFVEGAKARGAELRAIAAIEETRGDAAAAMATLREARAADPSDGRAALALDRLLAAASFTEERIALLVDEAARAGAAGATPAARDEARVRALLRASAVAEEHGDATRAIELARACLVASPGDALAIDALSRLLASPRAEAQAAEARARIAVHVHAAEHARDAARRIAHLEAAALLTEEMLGDLALAARTYERILLLEPQRRTALLGLARTARRAGDAGRYVRALLEEAAVTADPRDADALRALAAEALAASDVAADRERALAITREIVARDPAHPAARRVEQRLHEDAGEWGLVDHALAERLAALSDDAGGDDAAKLELLVERAELLGTRLRDPDGAMRALREALALAPGDEELRRAIALSLEAGGDARRLKDGLVELAGKVASPAASIDALVRAAEQDELVLGDDASAGALLDRAIALAPEDRALAERRARIAARLAGGAPAAPSIEECERALASDPSAVDALRGLEAAARREGSAPRLANALSRQAEVWRSTPARLGALFGVLELVEWTLPPSDPAPLLDTILSLAPDDVAAQDARLRCALAAVRRGDEGARAQLDPVRRWVSRAAGGERILARLALALALDADAPAGDDASSREALAAYAAVLAEDPGSLVAAYGATRLGALLGDDPAFIAGTTALAAIVPPAERATRLTQAAAKLLTSRDPSLGPPAARLDRALAWLDDALEASPDAVPPAALLVGARAEETHRDRVLAVLRRALERATTPAAAVHHGTELARIARLDPPDRVLAVEALRRVVAAAPEQASAWRALADVALEQGATAEAATALESLVASARDPRSRMGALFALAELYRGRSDGAEDVERVLRLALDTDPTSERAVRELLAVRRAEAPQAELTALLARLVEAVHGAEAKATVLGELADAHLAASDAPAAEQALIEACASAPNAARLGRLLSLHPSSVAEQARVLGAAAVRADALGRADPAVLFRLARLEIEALAHPSEGVAHLRRALALAPTMHEARATLARGLVEAGGATEAIATVASMIVPDASPLLSLSDPAAALATLERAFALDKQPDESIVARELGVVAGGLDDGAHVELRARRLAPGTLESQAGAFDRGTLLSAVAPPGTAGIALALARALEGAEGKLARSDEGALGIPPRARGSVADSEPQRWMTLAAAVLGMAPPPFAASDRVATARVALVDGEPWVVAPSALAARPPPEQLTTVARPLVRIALGVPWIDDLPGADTHALLIAAARRVTAGYASGLVGPEVEERVDEMGRRIGRALGALAFKQKKALGDLAGPLASEPQLDAHGSYAFAVSIVRTELRFAFLLSGDLLATLDSLRASDAAFGGETERVGRRALAAALTHPAAVDLARFALSRQTTTLRGRLGTTWGRSP